MSASRKSAAAPRVSPRLLAHIPLVILVVFSVTPLLLLILNSVKTDTDIKANPLGWPATWNWSNFSDAWTIGTFTSGLLNSLFVSAVTVIVVCVCAGLTAYSLARLDPPGGSVVITYYLIASTVPGILFLVPLFVVWSHLGLTNSLPAIALLYVALYLPYATLLLRSYFVNLPREIEEAALVDGASEAAVFVRVVLPMSWPAFSTVALIVSIWSWNEFLFAITFLQDPGRQTIAVHYLAFTGQYLTNYAYLASGGVIMILPAIILFLSLQRKFIEGLSSGGMKG
jgi:raffinose/stachyose/melibiose transport system permease protein